AVTVSPKNGILLSALTGIKYFGQGRFRTKDVGRRTNLPLHSEMGLAIVPAHLIPEQREQCALQAIPVLHNWVRGTLLGIAAGLVIVFAVAAWLDPYDADGQALRMATHRQLGLPPCTFYR